MKTLTVQGKALEVLRLPSAHPVQGAPSIVFLHEGLGSVAMWRDFPQRVADVTGCEAVVFSRLGHGRSDPLVGDRAVDYMHVEALQVLPDLLAQMHIEAPLLFGHSDGGSIALIHAGCGGHDVTAIIAMAPHVLVEDISVKSIAEAGAAWRTTDLPQRLGRYHDHVESMFQGWNRIWLDSDFRAWNIEACLATIDAPILAIQGLDDEYGSMEQIDRIAGQAGDVELVKLADCRHSPHKDQVEAVLEAVQAFVARVLD